MNIVQLLAVIEELASLYKQLEADGTIQKLKDAEGAIAAELASNATLKDLISKVTSLKV